MSDWCGHFSFDLEGNCMRCADEARIRELQAQAWDEGAAKASPHGGAYLRSFYAENPYRASPPEGTDDEL